MTLNNVFYLKNDDTVLNALTICKYHVTTHGSEQRKRDNEIILKRKVRHKY